MGKNIKEVIKYWALSAEHDYKTMLGLYRINRKLCQKIKESN